MEMTHLYTAIPYAIAGLGLFLFAIKLLSNTMKNLTSETMLNFMKKMKKNWVLSFLLGLVFTTIIQTSSGTVALTIGLIGAGMLSLRGAIPFLLGANIGTATTSILVWMSGADKGPADIAMYVSTFLLIGSFLYTFAKSKSKLETAMIFIGLGGIFLGLKVFGSGMKEISKEPGFQSMIDYVAGIPWLGFPTSVLLTGLLQSSSSVITLIQNAFSEGAVFTGGAMAMVLGTNVGTTITGYVASLGGNKDTKRIAFIWLFVNLSLALVLMLFVNQYADWMHAITPDGQGIKLSISFGHLIFNTALAFIFFPLTSLLEKMSFIVVKEDVSEIKNRYDINLSDKLLIDAPELAFESAHLATYELAIMTQDSVNLFKDYLNEPNKKIKSELKDTISLIDITRTSLYTYLVDLGSRNVSKSTSNKQVALVLVSRSLERIALLSKQVIDAVGSPNKQGEFEVPKETVDGMIKILEKIMKMLKKTSKQIKNFNREGVKVIRELEEKIDKDVTNLSEKFVLLHSSTKIDVFAILKLLSRISHHASRVNTYMRRGSKMKSPEIHKQKLKKYLDKFHTK